MTVTDKRPTECEQISGYEHTHLFANSFLGYERFLPCPLCERDRLRKLVLSLQADIAALQRDHAASAARVDARVAAADALADAVQAVIHAQTNYTIDIVGLDKMKAQHKALLAYRKLAQPDAARPAGEQL